MSPTPAPLTRAPEPQDPSTTPRRRVLVLVSGHRELLEECLREVERVYPDADLEVIAQAECAPWIRQVRGIARSSVVETPFQPFGTHASRLLQELRGAPLDACALVVDRSGIGDLRLRLFALRLACDRFHLLPSSTARAGRAMGRLRFAAGLALALSLRAIRAATWLDQLLLITLALAARHRPRGPGGEHGEVLHVIPSVGMGGAQRQLLRLMKGRSAASRHRILACSSLDRYFERELRETGVPIAYLDLNQAEVARGLSEWAPSGRIPVAISQWLFVLLRACLPICGELLSLAAYVSALRPRPAVVHCWLLYANLIGSIAARLAGVPRVITSIRNIQSEVLFNYYDPRWQRPLERATAPLASVVVANSPAVAKDYRRFARVRASKVTVIENGIEPAAFPRHDRERRSAIRRDLGIGPDDLLVGCVARLAKEKDFPTFIRALDLARRALPALHGIVVGDGPLRPQIESAAAAAGLAGVLRLVGERKDIGDILQAFDVFLLTSVIEGMPNVVLESQLVGTPVVATAAGGTVDLIQHGETGLLAPIGDAPGLARGIVQVLTDRGLHSRISAAARDRVLRLYTAERFVQRTEELYVTPAARR